MMFTEENVDVLRPGLTPFPDHVFVDDQPWLADHLLPLLSIDLGILRPELAGTVVHMLQPIYPIDGYLGDTTGTFHNEFTATNWFGFHLTEDNRYRFLGRKEYFAPYLEKDAASVLESWSRVRAYALQHGRLPRFSPYRSNSELGETNWLDILGGDFWEGNWTRVDSAPAFELTHHKASDRIELHYNGKPFFQVACANGLTILMFYEPDSRTVVFTFDAS